MARCQKQRAAYLRRYYSNCIPFLPSLSYSAINRKKVEPQVCSERHNLLFHVICEESQQLTTNLGFVRPVSTVPFPIALPKQRNTPVVSPTAPPLTLRTIADALTIIGSNEMIRTSAAEVLSAGPNKAQMGTSSVVASTGIGSLDLSRGMDYLGNTIYSLISGPEA